MKTPHEIGPAASSPQMEDVNHRLKFGGALANAILDDKHLRGANTVEAMKLFARDIISGLKVEDSELALADLTAELAFQQVANAKTPAQNSLSPAQQQLVFSVVAEALDVQHGVRVLVASAAQDGPVARPDTQTIGDGMLPDRPRVAEVVTYVSHHEQTATLHLNQMLDVALRLRTQAGLDDDLDDGHSRANIQSYLRGQLDLLAGAQTIEEIPAKFVQLRQQAFTDLSDIKSESEAMMVYDAIGKALSISPAILHAIPQPSGGGRSKK